MIYDSDCIFVISLLSVNLCLEIKLVCHILQKIKLVGHVLSLWLSVKYDKLVCSRITPVMNLHFLQFAVLSISSDIKCYIWLQVILFFSFQPICNARLLKLYLIYFQEHRDLEARIAQIIKSTEETPYTPPARPPHKAHKYSFQTRPYNENDEEEAVMDDEELHSLLGV